MIAQARALTVEDVQKVLDKFEIKMPKKLVKELFEWRMEFWSRHTSQ
jgi:hypothetical protein